MLSILIPTFNYNVVPLVLELQKQADNLGIDYEILVQDDCSKQFISENAEINKFENCSFFENSENLGRGRNINLLAKKSKFKFALILESDAFPEKENYLKNFIDILNDSTSVIFGGVKYPNAVPEKDKILRWKYGINRETKSLKNRLQNNYDYVFTWNLLLKKGILLENPFPEFIKEYGYEDLIFIKNLRLKSIPIQHIENCLVHQNDETSEDFIVKSEKAVQTLYQLIQTNKIDFSDSNLSKLYLKIKTLHFEKLVYYFFRKTKKILLQNLTSSNPNLFFLDFYKLGYFCSLKFK